TGAAAPIPGARYTNGRPRWHVPARSSTCAVGRAPARGWSCGTPGAASCGLRVVVAGDAVAAATVRHDQVRHVRRRVLRDARLTQARRNVDPHRAATAARVVPDQEPLPVHLPPRRIVDRRGSSRWPLGDQCVVCHVHGILLWIRYSPAIMPTISSPPR